MKDDKGMLLTTEEAKDYGSIDRVWLARVINTSNTIWANQWCEGGPAVACCREGGTNSVSRLLLRRLVSPNPGMTCTVR